MPTHFTPEETPVVQFDPTLEISPFVLFRRLREGRDVLLIDCRSRPDERSLAGARPLPADEELPTERDVVIFDDDGAEALAVVRRLQAAGLSRVRMLFGGLDLYEFSLSPEIVGEETYLRVAGSRLEDP